MASTLLHAGASVDLLHRWKVHCLSDGIVVTEAARRMLSQDGAVPLTLHEYATTGGITMRAGDVFINAPFDQSYPRSGGAVLDVHAGAPSMTFEGHRFPVEVLPLPGYLDATDPRGRPVTECAMSHADRVRLSPIVGCSYSCHFCDLAGKRYVRRDAEQLLAALEVALADRTLPVHHALVSGGTPSPRDRDWFVDVAGEVARGSPVPVDVMMTPWEGTGYLDDLLDASVLGFSLNLEVYGETAWTIAPQKHALGHATYAASLRHAVEQTGGRGRVRSLLLVGLEPMEDLLAGVEFLARLGCDPVLSPFRPTPGTPLADYPAPDVALLREAHDRAHTIATDYGVRLGPRCIPCQHNTLTLPDGSADYHYSRDAP